jgi:uncharacterized membrane protein
MSVLAIVMFCVGALISGVVIVSGILHDYPGSDTVFIFAIFVLALSNIALIAFLWEAGKPEDSVK